MPLITPSALPSRLESCVDMVTKLMRIVVGFTLKGTGKRCHSRILSQDRKTRSWRCHCSGRYGGHRMNTRTSLAFR